MKHVIFGESHGNAIGVVIENPVPGIELDWEFINSEMARRAPGKNSLSTSRKESDNVEILSGVYEGKTTGTPLCAVIRNENTRSEDYSKLMNTPRPSHGDFSGSIKYAGNQDPRGGGHFSGRLTAPLVFAGALAKLILKERKINISASISKVGGIADPSEKDIENVITEARENNDSVGGAVRCSITGMPAGLGSPDFGRNIEGIISQYMFAVPAVKAISFGAGFGFADMHGSEANDPFIIRDGKIVTETNHSGGINGGITNGMPVEFEVAFRPTPSIGKAQKTVDISEMKETEIEIVGRHDPCIVPRAVVVVEASAALAACEILGV